MTIEQINALPGKDFVDALGWVFEGSAWVAERAWEHGPFANVDGLHATMVNEVMCAAREEQVALLRAHPDLGTAGKMSEASAGEQGEAGLDRLTPQEYERLKHLNAAYRDKFGFPFILAVKGAHSRDIWKAMIHRFACTPEEEFGTALEQVFRIAHFRLLERVLDPPAGS